MGLLHQLFTVEELKSLDLNGIEILKAAIQGEIRSTAAKDAVKNAISGNVRAVYTKLKAPKTG